MPKRLVIYCDESSSKGTYCSNFYGGGLLEESDRIYIEDRLYLEKAKTNLSGEIKWTKIGAYNEHDYISMIDETFELIELGRLKIRIMFTQNIHQIQHLNHDPDREYFALYYQFIKLAFGLKYSTQKLDDGVDITVLLDKVPNTSEQFENFKNYLSSLSSYPIFFRNNVVIQRQNITDVDSSKHIILQMVDVILGAMQFRLNLKHKEKPEGARIRGKKTRAKERVYKHINSRIRKIYPNFNIGASTGTNQIEERWTHPYRHWVFIPSDSIIDRKRGKRKK